jgi:hypothetical protein
MTPKYTFWPLRAFLAIAKACICETIDESICPQYTIRNTSAGSSKSRSIWSPFFPIFAGTNLRVVPLPLNAIAVARRFPFTRSLFVYRSLFSPPQSLNFPPSPAMRANASLINFSGVDQVSLRSFSQPRTNLHLRSSRVWLLLPKGQMKYVPNCCRQLFLAKT